MTDPDDPHPTLELAESAGAPEADLRERLLAGLAGGADARARVLATADPAMRLELERLFAAHDALPPEPVREAPREPAPGRWIGDTFGGFALVSLLATGGTADIYLARQRSPAREVVLKVRRARHGTPGQVRRFLAEAEHLAAFAHPGVAHVYGSGVEEREGSPVAWIAMERIGGTPLASWPGRSDSSVATRARIVAEVAATIAAGHATGLVHRDIAPANIAIEPNGRARVIDFGIGRALHALDAHPTLEGTSGFASPEQAAGLPADPRDDVHALGRLLAWLVPDAPPAVRRLAEEAGAPTRAGRPDAALFAERLSALVAPRGGARTLALLASALAVFTLLGFAAFATRHLASPGTATPLAEGAAPAATAGASPTAAPGGIAATAVEEIVGAVLESASAVRGGASPTVALAKARAARDSIAASTGTPARTAWRALERLATLERELGDRRASAETSRLAATIAERDPETTPERRARLRAWSAMQLAFTDDRTGAQAAVAASLAELETLPTADEDGAVAPVADDPRHGAHADFAQSLRYLQLAAKLNGDLALARDIARRASPFHESGVAAGGKAQVVFLVNRARLEQALGDLGAAVASASAAVEASKVAEADDPIAQLETLGLQAGILEEVGRLAEAGAVYHRLVETWSELAGPNDPKTITALNNLGLNLERQGDSAGAIAVLEDACTRALRVHGERHRHTIDDHGNLALAYRSAGRIDDALALVARWLPIVREARGSPSVDECDWLLLLGELEESRGAINSARAAFEETARKAEGLVGAEVNLDAARRGLARLAGRTTPPSGS